MTLKLVPKEDVVKGRRLSDNEKSYKVYTNGRNKPTNKEKGRYKK